MNRTNYYSKNDGGQPTLPSIQRVCLQSIAAEDPDGRFVEVNGIQTYYKLTYPQSSAANSATESKPIILLMHHFMGNLYTWRYFMGPLADATGLPVLAYDRVTFGFTERPAQWNEDNNPYTQEAAVDFALAVVNAVGFRGRQLAIIGVSAGGAMACSLATKHPGLVKAIVLLCPSLRPQDQGPPPVACHILGSAPGRLFIKAALYNYLPLTSLYHHAEAIPQWETIVKPSYRVPLTLPNFYESVSYLMRYFQPLQILEDPPQHLLTTPMLYITGTNDRYTSLEIHIQVYQDLLRKAPENSILEFQTLDACGHLPQDEKPQEVLDSSLDFFKRTGLY